MSKLQDNIRDLLDLHTMPSEPLEVTKAAIAEPRPSPHAPGCWCLRCWDTGMQVGEYLKAKKLFNDNGF